MFATQAASAMENDRRTTALHSKLVNRDVIGEVSAMLMQRFEIDAPRAFLLLLRLSETTKMAAADCPPLAHQGYRTLSVSDGVMWSPQSGAVRA